MVSPAETPEPAHADTPEPGPADAPEPGPADAQDQAEAGPGPSALDGVLLSASMVLVTGPGGVGKTTLSAAMATRAAVSHGRRVLLVTVDPARRLADALGHGLSNEPVLVPVGPGSGRLWAVMVDMGAAWDTLVTECAPEPADAEAVLANPLYRTLTTRFVQSHDYVALDFLCHVAAEPYDLIVVDTPPSAHAIDILDAPDRLVEFFDSFLLRSLTAPYRSRLAAVTARPFLSLAERLLGGSFLSQVAELFWLFSRLQPGLVDRSRRIGERLGAADTTYVVATTAEPLVLGQAGELVDALVERERGPHLVLHNRAPHRVEAEVLASIVDPSLRAAMAALAGDGHELASWLEGEGRSAVGPVVPVPWRPGPLGTVAELARLFDAPPSAD